MEGNEVKRNDGRSKRNDGQSRWATAIRMKVLLGEDPFTNGVLQGIHDDLGDSIENDKGTTWPEVYSYLLADIAKSLRQIAESSNGGGGG
tara:strand:- start:444 stop:713 length:270 start_codon:yes stop_codon:yes gene_type:complete